MDQGEKIEFISIISFVLASIFLFFYLNHWLNKKAKDVPAYSDYSKFSIQSLPDHLADKEQQRDEDKALLCKSNLK